MRVRFTILVLLALLVSQSAFSATPAVGVWADSTHTKLVPLPKIHAQPHPFWGRRSVQVGAGLVGAGVVLTSADLQTRQLRHDYLPTFRYKYDLRVRPWP